MKKELICYAIIPLKGKDLKLTDFNETNTFSQDAKNILCVTDTECSYTQFNGCKDILILNNVADIKTFWKRLKFCFCLLFNWRF
jgi:hypothetical protein